MKEDSVPLVGIDAILLLSRLGQKTISSALDILYLKWFSFSRERKRPSRVYRRNESSGPVIAAIILRVIEDQDKHCS